MSNNSLEKLFQILAVLFVGVAAFFYWQDNYDGVFISAVLGCVSFFLSYRFQFKEQVDEWEADYLEKELAEENERVSLFGGDFSEDELADLKLDNDKEEISVER